jgi:L-2-hydroxyglutarate oxidase
VAAHQSGRNSGVIHSGLYYQPGSAKARMCVAGREALLAFCREHGVRHEPCGKLLVACDVGDLPRLAELEARGRANGLEGLCRLTAEQVREREPHTAGIGGLLVPQTGIVSFREVSEKLADLVRAAGHEVQMAARVRAIEARGGPCRLHTTRRTLTCRRFINCAGLQSDRIARMAGLNPGLRIVPFRGEYHALRPQRGHLVRHLIYPVPDPSLPFLGVHFTRTIDGPVTVGPNAVAALHREGYRRSDVSARDLIDLALYGGFWRMAWRHRRTALSEWHRALSIKAFARAAQRLVPELDPGDLCPWEPGVRAQAVEPDGSLVDDFRIITTGRAIHVLNAPSPAATAALAIGRHIAELAQRNFALEQRR